MPHYTDNVAGQVRHQLIRGQPHPQAKGDFIPRISYEPSTTSGYRDTSRGKGKKAPRQFTTGSYLKSGMTRPEPPS